MRTLTLDPVNDNWVDVGDVRFYLLKVRGTSVTIGIEASPSVEVARKQAGGRKRGLSSLEPPAKIP